MKLKLNGKQKMYLITWIPFCIFAIINVPDPMGIAGLLLLSGYLWWKISKELKNENTS
jgi:hypothetical protein